MVTLEPAGLVDVVVVVVVVVLVVVEVWVEEEEDVLVVVVVVVIVVVLVCGPQLDPVYTAVSMVLEEIEIGVGSASLPVRPAPCQ